MEHIDTLRKERRSMKHLLSDSIRVISDSGNPVISKLITYFGFTGAGISTAQVAAESSAIQKAIPAAAEFSRACAESPQWIVYIPAFVAFTLAFKHGADFYFRRLEHKKIMNETKTDKDNLC